MLDDGGYFTVTDLKQYAFCPRVIFYERCLPHVRPRTYKMDAGQDAHEEEAGRAAQRTLAAYGLPAGERCFDVRLVSPRLRLSGKLDELVKTGDEWIPVDYKLAKAVGTNHRVQLAAYAALLEDVEGIPVRRGFIYLIPARKTVEVPMTAALREQLRAALEEVWTLVTREIMPPATSFRNSCPACEFRRFCNDV